MILYQKPYITIEYDENQQCLTQHWQGFAISAQFREAIEESVSYFKDYKITKLISNTKDFAVVKKEDTDWVATHATPKLVEQGLTYMAFIVPTNIFTQVSMSNFKNKAGDLLQIQYFDDLEAARDWLAQVK